MDTKLIRTLFHRGRAVGEQPQILETFSIFSKSYSTFSPASDEEIEDLFLNDAIQIRGREWLPGKDDEEMPET